MFVWGINERGGRNRDGSMVVLDRTKSVVIHNNNTGRHWNPNKIKHGRGNNIEPKRALLAILRKLDEKQRQTPTVGQMKETREATR